MRRAKLIASLAVVVAAAAGPQAHAAPEDTPAPAISPVTAADLGASWRAGCPLAPSGLRLVEVDYLGFDGQSHRGALIVKTELAQQVQEIFAELEAIRFPIEKIRPAAEYAGAEDELSMRDNNTSAFNCRGIPGSSSWSEHAYGRAIDINPLLNPYISASGAMEPATAGPYLDRTLDEAGMLRDGHPAVEVFTDRGWTWGGNWRDPKDYQHFEYPAG
ncbi:M15 family metallopeptidase [Mycolicibacterium brumae]|uniref:Peptidase M15 n=1 Tax=Mycolicibacterium brumae TaxID=85968 RepID=A0A2G5P536_9MYCO|nr:M15 family metallopeptidase [Mycolicibacterium brumae]PIB73405.1 peptidase M15 [Mycolicibacterium brumae]